ncbi:MAG: hypothetical protein N3A38_14035 [Planctomycetota bacterium]|nr:hypothetical protein [Planctomycetota bacterium]
MGWNLVPVEPGQKMLAAQMEEVREALTERMVAVQAASPPLIIYPGNRIMASQINTYRLHIEQVIAGSFRRKFVNHLGGIGEGDHPEPWTLADLLTEYYGEPREYWTRFPARWGGTLEEGELQPGDRCLAEHINELRGVLDLLQWVRITESQYTPGKIAADRVLYARSGWTWAEAWANVKDSYVNHGPGGVEYEGNNDARMWAYREPGATYQATLAHVKGRYVYDLYGLDDIEDWWMHVTTSYDISVERSDEVGAGEVEIMRYSNSGPIDTLATVDTSEETWWINPDAEKWHPEIWLVPDDSDLDVFEPSTDYQYRGIITRLHALYCRPSFEYRQ